MKENNRFQKGSGVYICECCGKKTRETGLGESHVELCAYCYEVAGWENSFSDGIITQEQFKDKIKNLKIKHKR